MSEVQEDKANAAEDASSKSTETKEKSSSQTTPRNAEDANLGKVETAGEVEKKEFTATVEMPEAPAEINLQVVAAQPPTSSIVAVVVDAVETPSLSLKAVTVPTPVQSAATKPETVAVDQTQKKDDIKTDESQRGGVGGVVGKATSSETVKPPPMQGKVFEAKPDDFYRSIFYFSGMGRVIGSALAEGVYVDEKNRRNAIDPEEVALYKGKVKGTGGEGEKKTGGAGEGELITTARNQANILSSEFRRLQSLLESIPTFTDTAMDRRIGSSGAGAGVRIDEPIHGDIYFRSERPHHHQQQQPMASSSQTVRQTYIIDQRPVPSLQQHSNGPTVTSNSWSYLNNW